MTFRSDITVDWSVSPRIITVLSPSTQLTIQDLVDTCRELEDDPVNASYPSLISAAGKESLGGGVSVGITATLENAVVAFEDRPGPSWVLCTLSGGNLVAVDSNGNSIDPRQPTAFVTVDRAASSSATLQDADVMQKILQNKTVTDPVTGIMTVYDDDGVTPLFTAQLYEDVAESQTYRGQGAEVRERLQ